MKRAVHRSLNSFALISENICRMHRGSPRRAAATSSGTWGRSSGSTKVPSAVAGPDLALRAQENCRKRAQQTIKNVNQGQLASREQMLQLARVVTIPHPHIQQTVELPQSRDPPEKAQLGFVGSGGVVSVGTLRPTATREASPPAAILDGVTVEKTPESGPTFEETAACMKSVHACKSRSWSWSYQAQAAEQFHVELDMEHVAPTNRTFRWELDEAAKRWQLREQQDQPTLLEAEDTLAPPNPEPLQEQEQAQLPGSGMAHTRGSMCAHVHMTQEHVHVPAAGSAVEPGWDSRKKSETYFPEAVWDKPHKPPYVHVVNTAEGARRAMQLLRTLVDKDVAAANSHAPVNDYGRKYWSRRIFACDTEATDIDVTTECAAGHGRVTCWTAYCGPDVNFSRDDLAVQPGVVPECVLYVDTYLSGGDDLPAVLEIWSELRPFLESDDYPKVWHNYGFDKHILQRRGFGIVPAKLEEHGHDPDKLVLSLGGFAGDTMHMARLHDAARKGTKNYSLASLTSDKTVMCAPDRSVLTRSKVSLKELFSRPKISKSGKPSASLKELPPIHEVQTAEDERMKWKWVDYSAFDSKATWDLYHSLREKLQATECTIDEDLRPGIRGSLPTYSQWDLYLDVLWPFGEALTAMEQEGFYVDKPHLAEQDVKAQADLHDAGVRFRTWLRKYAAVVGQGNEELGWHPDDIPGLVNLSSPSQIQTLLFGGFTAAKDVLKKPTKAEAEAGMKEHMVKPTVEIARQFMMDNPKYGEPGERKQMPFKLTCVFGSQGTAIAHDCVTMVTAAQGLPMTSAAALRALCGKPGAAKKLLKELDTSNVHAAGAEAAEALGDMAAGIAEADGGHVSSADEASDGEARVMTKGERVAYQNDKGLGHLYSAFQDHKDGLEACAAVEALIEISAIETLRSSFLLPLQGDAVSAEDGRVHCSLNLNTETGRLSCRRPNLQNQPALEKDRYFIRKAFRAPAGRTLVVADYGQLELRILAHMTGCVSMIAAFDSGGDFHSRTAAGMFPEIQKEIEAGNVAMDHMDPNFKEGMVLVKDKYSSERRKAKILNFSLAYGKTEYGLSKDFNVTLAEAKGIVERWYKSRPEVAKWQAMVREQAKKDVGLHRVQTMLGRHRMLPGYGKGKTSREEARASRAAINTPIQGSAADVVAAAMVRIHHDPFFRQLGWRMLLQVHDEVIMEGPEESSEAAQARLVECMQKPFIKDRATLHELMSKAQAGEPPVSADWDACYHCGMRLELTVDSNVANTWYEAK